jgi:uncharacterized protein YdbL (DUF1318 family)
MPVPRFRSQLVPLWIRAVAGVVGACAALYGAGVVGHQKAKNEFQKTIEQLKEARDVYKAMSKDFAHVMGLLGTGVEAGLPAVGGENIPAETSLAPSGARTYRRGDVLLGLLGVGIAGAEESSDADALVRLQVSIAKRFADLKRYKRDGALGENHEGYVEIVPERLQSATARKLMSDEKYAKKARETKDSENRDRNLLYGIRARITGASVQKVAATYAEGWRAGASPGEWIEVPVGKKGPQQKWQWKKK